MATKHGSIGEFDAGREDWQSYAERLEQYFVANDVTNTQKKRALLLSVCGAATYQLIRNLVAPAKPTSRTFEELVELVRNHHNPKPSIIVERFKFHSCVRRQGESVATFVASLRQLTLHCAFGESLDDMLRDRLVCGINEARLQRRLLAEPTLTFEKAMGLATAWESAEKNAQHLQPTTITPGETVHTVRKNQESEAARRQRDECYRCGGRHNAETCNFRDAECFGCGKRGHLARMCRRRERSRTGGGAQANWLDEEGEQGTTEELPEEYSLF